MDTSKFPALIERAVANATVILTEVFSKPDESEQQLGPLVQEPGKLLALLLGDESDQIHLSERMEKTLQEWFEKIVVESTADSARAVTDETREVVREMHQSRLELTEEVIEAIFSINESTMSGAAGSTALIMDLTDAVAARDRIAIQGKDFSATDDQIEELRQSIEERCSFSALF